MSEEAPPTPLREAFADPGSRVAVTVMFVDMVGSTAIKSTMPEAGWLQQIGFMYDVVTRAVHEPHPEAHMKFLGDGVLVVYEGDDCGLAAITAAVQIQEVLSAASTSVDGAMGAINFNVSIGITSGVAHRFLAPDGSIDHVGLTVDKAARLCGAASPKAIFLDKATYTATNFLRVVSKVGSVLGRAPEEYAGDRQTAALKGLPQPVEYHELYWERQLFGIRSEFVTGTTATTRVIGTAASTGGAVAAAPRVSGKIERLIGTVKNWSSEKQFGFVVGPGGEEFYVGPSLLVYAEDADDMRPGAQVAFVAIDAVAEGKSRRAAACLLVDSYADGVLVVPPAGRPHGWVEVKDRVGNGQLVFVSPTDCAGDFERGTAVNFKIQVGPRGAHAVDLDRADRVGSA
jgi:class 3 adenylate cyclase/cold shock CspA family protein